MTSSAGQMKTLTDPQLMRYSRQIMLPNVDIDGQERLWNSRVLIIGLGGLGCAVAQYLAAAGIGQLTFVDDDLVDRTNLQRQILHYENRLGCNKAWSAQQTCYQINSEINIDIVEQRLDNLALSELITSQDVVVDCSDNLATREQLNLICLQQQVPLISGAAIRMEGQVSTFIMKEGTACYKCVSHVFGEQNLTCSEAGILSPVVGLVGTIQATEAIKVLTEVGDVLSNKLLMIDAATMQFNHFNLQVQPNCPHCQKESKS